MVVGESGSGKDTLVDAVCEKYGYKKLISYTTRPMRNTENDKKAHHFISKSDLRKLNNIVAYTYFNGNEYCATQEQVDESDFYIIDCDGVEYLKKMYNGDKQIVVVHIDVPKVDRFLRMKKRDGTVKAMERIRHDEKAFANVKDLCDFAIDNTDKDMTQAIEMLRNIIEREI